MPFLKGIAIDDFASMSFATSLRLNNPCHLQNAQDCRNFVSFHRSFAATCWGVCLTVAQECVGHRDEKTGGPMLGLSICSTCYVVWDLKQLPLLINLKELLNKITTTSDQPTFLSVTHNLYKLTVDISFAAFYRN